MVETGDFVKLARLAVSESSRCNQVVDSVDWQRAGSKQSLLSSWGCGQLIHTLVFTSKWVFLSEYQTLCSFSDIDITDEGLETSRDRE